jgi:2-dehydro-3-deoxyphosphooctonate aldolase (KDO 8-P synthase)
VKKPQFNYKGLRAGNGELLFIAGPCVIEDEETVFTIARKLKKIRDELSIQLVFKASFDKANRTSLDSYRGPGIDEGLRILKAVGEETGLPLLTDIHTPAQAEKAGEAVDILQIPAFLCRQTDMLRAACETGKAVNVKKGQFVAGSDMQFAAEKCHDARGEGRLLLTERGNAFGYHNLVVDMRNLALMREYAPVIYDATHSVQLPSAGSGVSGGGREYIPGLASAAAAMGIDGLFMEVHTAPEKGRSDAATMFPIDTLAALYKRIISISNTARGEYGGGQSEA